MRGALGDLLDLLQDHTEYITFKYLTYAASCLRIVPSIPLRSLSAPSISLLTERASGY